ELPGMLLGVCPEIDIEERELTLEPGRTLVIHTDGFELAFPDEHEAESIRRRGNKRYLERFAALRRDPSATLHEAIEALAATIDAHRGSLHQVDDMTVLAV